MAAVGRWKVKTDPLALTQAELRLLHQHAASLHAKDFLQNILFDGPRGICAATDGHALVVRLGAPFPGKWLLSRGRLQEVERIAGTMRTELHHDRVEFFGEQAFTLPVKPEPDGSYFPSMGAALTGEPGGAPVRFDPARMGKIVDGLKAVGCPSVAIRTFGERHPLRIWAESESADWVVLLMPMDPHGLSDGNSLMSRLAEGGKS